MPPSLVGLGEIMQMTEADNEMESINFDDMVARIKRVGCVVETFASLISYCYAVHRASEYAIENFDSYQEGRSPGPGPVLSVSLEVPPVEPV